jgi:hypothetical protein
MLKLFTLIFVIAIAALTKGTVGWDGNHATYLLPGLTQADPSLLTYDWWTQNNAHYHFAFNFLVNSLVNIGLLIPILDALTVTLFTLFFVAMFKLATQLTENNEILSLFVTLMCCYLFFVNFSFFSVGESYLLSNMVQPSSISMVCSIWAYYFFFNDRLKLCSLLLLCAGLFHVNFLLLNIALLGTCYFFQAVVFKVKTLKISIRESLVVLVPSIILTSILLPYIFSFASSIELTDTEKSLSSFVFLEFAVPFHYLTSTFLIDFYKLLGSHILGICSLLFLLKNKTNKGISIYLSFYLSLCLMLWAAFFLTTTIFIEPVARLFFWRLAPISELLSFLFFSCCIATSTIRKSVFDLKYLKVLLIGTLIGLLLILRTQFYKHSVYDLRVFGFILFFFVCFFIIALSRLSLFSKRSVMTSSAVGAVICLLIIFASHSTHSRNHLNLASKRESQSEIFNYVKENTPEEAVFLTPIFMDGFRYFAQRAVVVEWKNIPFDKLMLIEWYKRLSDVSMVSNPKSLKLVDDGYHGLTESDLQKLASKYSAGFAIFNKAKRHPTLDSKVVFENESFYVTSLRP